jgi:ABC-type glycerol-3-phosphate transport system substrate-binding protein
LLKYEPLTLSFSLSKKLNKDLKMTRKMRLIFLSAAMAFIVLPGCKSQKATPENRVVVWHWMTDREQAFNTLAAKYKEATGVDVEFQLYAPSDVYKQKVSVGAQTKSLPDVFGVLGDARELASFANAGHVANLKSVLEESTSTWKKTFYEGAVQTAYFPPGNQFNVEAGYYGVPIDVTTIPLIYNKKLFAKAGLNPAKAPATWAEFLEDGKALKKAGVSGFVSGWGEPWLIYCLATNIAHNVMGMQKMMDTFQGKVPYTDPDWIKVFAAFEELQKAGFADPSLVTLQNKNSEQAFSSERSGMTLNGSWGVNVYAGMNPNLDYAPFATPALGNKFPRTVWAGAGTVFSVNQNSPNKDLAINFLKWLTAKEQMAYLVEQTKNLPSIKGLDKNIPPVLAQFAKLADSSIHPTRFQWTEEPTVQEVFNKGIQSILIKEKTAQEVAAEVQATKTKVSGR